MRQIAVIGRYCGQENFCDGQTVKTRNLVDLLEKDGGYAVFLVDTYNLKKNPLRLIFDTFRAVIRCRHIFLTVSTNGMNFYLRFFYCLSKLCKRHVYHDIIGSELLDMVRENPKLVRYLNALDVNWFEFEQGTRYLREQGVTNAETMPNFKRITPVEQAKPYRDEAGLYRFCTFSRVMREKGVTDAIQAVHAVNEKLGGDRVRLDIYGPVEEDYRRELAELTERYADEVCYKGVADSADSVAHLKDYYALLFPTRWRGEGVPGTLIDAFASGLPVIASDWHANRDIVCDGITGLIYPSVRYETLEEALLWALEEPEEMDRMRFAARAEFDAYTPDAILDRIRRELRRRGCEMDGAV